MKTLTFFLFLAVTTFSQINTFHRYSLFYSSGGSYEIETLAYKTRVEADGGEVININLLNDFIKEAKEKGYYDSLLCCIDANFGVKKNANNKIIKVYDLFQKIRRDANYYSNDYSQSDTSKSPSYIPLDQNNLSGMRFYGINDVLVVTHPEFINTIPQPLTAFVTIKIYGAAGNFVDNGSGRIIFGLSGGKLYIYNGSLLNAATSYVTNTPYIYAGVFNSTSSKIYINNSVNSTGNSGSDGWGSLTSKEYYLGASGTASYTNITLYSFIIKKGIGNISNINTFLNSKYNIY